MKKLIPLVLGLLIAGSALTKPVTPELARMVALKYFQHLSPSGITDFSIKESLEVRYHDLATYYAFNFTRGGFVLVAADDAVIPILGYSNEGFVEKEISNTAVRAWFDGYNREIFSIVKANPGNTSTLPLWNNILEGTFMKSGQDIGPLITSTWDQGVWYNYYCPADAHGIGGKALAGCVATAAGMIMKYHNFPQKGTGSHSYHSYKYGVQTVDFEATAYDWAGMGTIAGPDNYQAIATLLYHFGVAANMNYGPDASGASYEDAALALVDYFNYDQESLRIIRMNDFTAGSWEQMLQNELDQSRPVYYSGYNTEEGHAFVCDGYRSADHMFHINWGWSGLYNGYYAVGSLNPPGSTYNLDNAAIIGIRPGNPDLVVRISSPVNNISISPGNKVDINANVSVGAAGQLVLDINDQQVATVNGQSLSYTWDTEGLSLGTYEIKVTAMNIEDTVHHSVSIVVGDWMTQNSGFPVPTRGIQYVHAVDSSVVWAIGYDGTSPKNYIQEFSRTVNGGAYWDAGIIPNCSGLVPSMIFGLNADTAYCSMHRENGGNLQGIYVTRDGGKTWTHQSSAYYETAGSFPNTVHFFNDHDGWAMGDPIFNHFLIHTTVDGGTTWNYISETSLPAPLSGEYGITGYYSAAGNHVWFGTSKGRVYHSPDKGYTWGVSTTTLANKWIDVEFADEFHGLAQDRSQGATGALSETFDGGATWQAVATSGPVYNADLAFVPGTGNTWVSTGSGQQASGASYSYDGGHTWQNFRGLEGVQLLATDWISNFCGWAGAFSSYSGKNGIYKFGGALQKSNLLAPANLKVTTTGRNVHLTWDAPAGPLAPAGYNVYRNNELITPVPVTQLGFDDQELGDATYRYCISAVYSEGESIPACTAIIVTSVRDEPAMSLVNLFPNPVTGGLLNINCAANFESVQIFSPAGSLIYENLYPCRNLRVITTGFRPGIYLVRVVKEDETIIRKIIVQ